MEREAGRGRDLAVGRAAAVGCLNAKTLRCAEGQSRAARGAPPPPRSLVRDPAPKRELHVSVSHPHRCTEPSHVQRTNDSFIITP